jgi:hypothetical protein
MSHLTFKLVKLDPVRSAEPPTISGMAAARVLRTSSDLATGAVVTGVGRDVGGRRRVRGRRWEERSKEGIRRGRDTGKRCWFKQSVESGSRVRGEPPMS